MLKMGWTNRQIIKDAFAESGDSDYYYDIEPEDLQKALRKLVVIMAALDDDGIRFGYPLLSSPEDGDLDQETNIPDFAISCVLPMLALSLCSMMGREPSRELKKEAKSGKNRLYRKYVKIEQMEMPASVPLGAGYKSSERRFFAGDK